MYGGRTYEVVQGLVVPQLLLRRHVTREQHQQEHPGRHPVCVKIEKYANRL